MTGLTIWFMKSHHLWPILSSIGEEEHLRDRFNNLVYDVTSPMAHFIFHR